MRFWLALGVMVLLTLGMLVGLTFFLTLPIEIDGTTISGEGLSYTLWLATLPVTKLTSYFSPYRNQLVYSIVESQNSSIVLIGMLALSVASFISSILYPEKSRSPLIPFFSSLILLLILGIYSTFALSDVSHKLSLSGGESQDLISIYLLFTIIGFLLSCIPMAITSYLGSLIGAKIFPPTEAEVKELPQKEVKPTAPSTVPKVEVSPSPLPRQIAKPSTITPPSSKIASDLEEARRLVELEAEKELEEIPPPRVRKPVDTGPFLRPPPCPTCGRPLKWVPKYKMYYCEYCKKYPM